MDAKPKKRGIKVTDLKARKNPKGGLNPQPEPPMVQGIKFDGLQSLKMISGLKFAADHKGQLFHK